MLQNKKLFALIVIASLIMAGAGIALIVTKNTAVPRGSIIPASTHLASVPPQAGELPDATSTISSLPLDVSYTQTRNIQDSIGYLAGNKKGANYIGSYRTNSRAVDSNGTVSFLVDVPSAKSTFIVLDNAIVECAPTDSQKEPGWSCTPPEGGR